MEAPGTCQPAFGGCCSDDGDCWEEGVCAIPPGQLFGSCQQDPNYQKCDGLPCCWMDSHCNAGEHCMGAGFCGCMPPWAGDCDAPVMGQCTPLLPLCCELDAECPAGLQCVGELAGEACVRLLPPRGCAGKMPSAAPIKPARTRGSAPVAPCATCSTCTGRASIYPTAAARTTTTAQMTRCARWRLPRGSPGHAFQIPLVPNALAT